MGANDLEILVELVMGLKSFKTNVHQLSNALAISQRESEGLLLDELISKRLKHTGLMITAIQSGDINQVSWQCTFCRKEIIRRHFRIENKQQHTVEVLKDRQATLIQMINQDAMDVEQIITLVQAQKLFVNSRTEQWVCCVLRFGRDETMARYGQNVRQFTAKLRGVAKYCDKHRQRFRGLIISKNDQALLGEEQQLLGLITALESLDYQDEHYQQLLTYHQDYVSDLIGDVPGIQCQPALLYHWATASNHDKYLLVNGMYARLQYIRQHLKER